MYRSEFDKILAKGNIPKAIMFFGESLFFIDRYIEILKNRVQPDEVTTFYNFDYNFQSAKGSISQGSLFASRQILIIKSEKEIANSELQELIKIATSSEDSYFLYIFYGERSPKNQKLFSPNFVRFFNPNFYESRNILLEESRRIGVSIPIQGIDRLIYRTNNNLSIAVQELEKLSKLQKTISVEEIDKFVAPPIDIGLDNYIHYFLRSGEYRQLVSYIETQSIDEVAIFSYSAKYLEEIYYFRTALERGKKLDSLSVLGRKLPPKVERERVEMAKKLDLELISKLLYLMAEGELNLKSGEVKDKKMFLIQKLIEIGKLLK